MKEQEEKSGCVITFGPIHWVFGTLTSIIGYNIHHNIFWAVMDWLFWPIAWMKWAFYHEFNMTLIKNSFSWFFN